MVKEDAKYTAREIAAYVVITLTATHIILTELLGLRKICAYRIPHFLTKEQKDSCVKCALETEIPILPTLSYLG